MPIYHYKDSPLIDSVKFRSLKGGVLHATIIAKDSADLASIEKLREQLGAAKFSTLIDKENGHTEVEVRGLRKEDKLLHTLSSLGHAKGGISKESTEADKHKDSFGDKVRGKAMFLSSIFYHVGNVLTIISGIQRGRHNKDGKFTREDWSELMIGVSFGVGDALMTAYGEDMGNEELQAAERGLKQHLHRKGIEIPQGEALNPDTLHQSGAVKAADRWLRKHIGQVKCLTETAAGLFMIKSGMKKRVMPDGTLHNNTGKLAAGFLVTAGWLSTFLLDKPRGDTVFRPEGYTPSSVMDGVADNPRGWIARPGAIGNNFLNLYGAYGEYKSFGDEVEQAKGMYDKDPSAAHKKELDYTTTKRHDYMWNVLAACAFLVANFLFGLSGQKKGPKETEDDKALMDDLVLLSANVLAKQPEKVREASIGEAADYVSTLAHVRATREEVAAAIRDKVQTITKEGWVERVQTAPQTSPQLA